MNPRMLQIARESRGLSQSALARLSGVSQSALSKAEHGLVELPVDRVAALAAALDYPRQMLDWPDEAYGLGPAAFHHRKQSGLGKTALLKIEAETNLLLMRLRRLESSVDIEPAYRLAQIDPDDVSPEEAARRLRAMWHVPSGPVHDAIRTVERAGVVVVRRDLGSPKISGLSTNPPDGLPVIVMNLGQPADRERFTVFHEVGHLVMHELPRDDGEREADRFAAEFLMPAAEIAPHLGGMSIQKAAQLKQYWKTSMSSIIRRAYTLGKINESRYRSLNVQMNQRGFRRQEPAEPPREEPRILEGVLDAHRVGHGYRDGELAQVVGLHVKEFQQEYGTRSAGRLRLVH